MYVATEGLVMDTMFIICVMTKVRCCTVYGTPAVHATISVFLYRWHRKNTRCDLEVFHVHNKWTTYPTTQIILRNSVRDVWFCRLQPCWHVQGNDIVITQGW